jgi:thioester reductase-like protein
MAPETLVELLRSRTVSDLPVGFRFLERGDPAGPQITMSWAELDLRARAVAARLQELGHAGERILLLFPPGLDFIVGFFGALYAGSVAVPAYPPDPTRLVATLPRLRTIVRDARPSAVLTTELVRQLSAGLAPQAPELAVLEVVAVDDLEPGWAQTWTDPRVAPDRLAFLQYTSGSTGSPRGVCLTHRQILANQRMIAERFSVPHPSCVSWLPLFHDMGLIGTVIQPLYRDTPVTLFSPLDFLKKPMSWLRAISTLRAHVSGGPDFAYALCARKAQPQDLVGLDLSCWELAFSGAEPVCAETLDHFARVFGDAGFDRRAFYPTYGLAEATLFVSGGVPGSGHRALSCDARALREGRVEPGSDQRLVSCGPPGPEAELAILRTDGSRAGPGEIGEICVNAPSVADGYWDAPEATAERFAPPWLKTGDLGFLHEGELYVAGRLKDLVIVRGRNHYPQDLERTVEDAHPAVRPGAVAAFSIPTDQGEGLALAVEVSPEADADEVERAIRSAVAFRHEVAVDGLALLPPRQLPKTSSGKIQRHAARRAWLEDTLGQRHRVGAPPSMPGGLPEWLVSWLEREGKVARARISAQVTLSELGLDSLALVQLAGAMEERLGSEVPVEVVFGRSLAEIAQWVDSAGLPTTALERPDLVAASQLADDLTLGPRAGGTELLLTGATGFLGSHLLAVLAEQAPGRILCLVRAQSREAGLERVLATARKLGISLDPARLEVICGDLSLPRLGMSARAFEELAVRLSRIVHCGAVVDWSATFSQLSAANVGGTHEIVRLAARGGGVAVHHVSSLGVFPMGLSRRDRFAEQEDLSEGELLRVAYFQTKWAAERVLEQARDKLGLPVTLYRPGFIAGHSQTGAELEASQQLLCAFLRGAVRMGQVPSVDKVLDVVPVDFVAQAIGKLVFSEDLAGRKLDLLNPSPMRQSELYALLRARGYPMREVAFPRWRQEVLGLPRTDPDNALSVFALYYRAVTPSVMRRLETLMAERLPIEDTLARTRLDALGVRCPPLDAQLLGTYLDRYVEDGLLPAPPRPAQEQRREEPADVHAPVLLPLEALARPWLPDLAHGQDRLVHLYEKAKAAQWDASHRLDWSLPVDPEDPQGLGDEGVPIWGSPLWKRLSVLERARTRVHHQGWQVSQFLAGEQGALLCASRLVQQAPDAASRMACATQVVDEMRHVEVFSRLLHEKIRAPYGVSPPLRRLLDDVLYDRRWDVTCLGMQVLIEGLGLAVFSMMRDRSTHPLISAAHRYVVEDEVRHVAFGRLLLEARNRELTEAERKEREEFVIEASYLLRDRFAAMDLWAQLDLPVSECAAWIEESGTMRHYRRELFRRIVPVVRGIGLWSPRVREAYEKMGVLPFAAETLPQE